MINCEGCVDEGLKTPFCEKLCPIQLYALKKTEYVNCISKYTCPKLKMVISTNEEIFRIIGNKNRQISLFLYKYFKKSSFSCLILNRKVTIIILVK